MDAHGAIDPSGRAAVGTDDAQFSAELLGYHSLPDANGVAHPKWTMLISTSPTGDGAWWAVSDADAVDNKWVHLAATHDASTGTMAFYVNGVKQHTCGCPLEPDTLIPGSGLGEGCSRIRQVEAPRAVPQGRRGVVRSSDRPLRQVARELGVNHETLRNWVRIAENAQAVRQPLQCAGR
ncbi:LamG-like jellyroll fold domain-containing protein [Amycolatopsis sp. FDAARGOS 1241]|uniref:LamG-like jellyroll fold domain-containing protein n=1 Tax=Amycolatopsis sp. FDAARGOS 1241 TaxID=2778070 RepID=UPI001950D61F|nr:LamG-like jellyroll fold domain-containing protein [Amycolatopsis sp. FDAARGOS 1241]QRP47921.1 transposase [Amycolatopsis sp. FDAARGOS 1241]